MFLTLFQIERINKATKILKVFDYYGIQYEEDGTDNRFRCQCPFHSDRTPSLKIYQETNTWYAYCCSKGYGPFDFCVEKEGSQEAAYKVICEIGDFKQYDNPIDEVEDLLQDPSEQKKDNTNFTLLYSISILLRDYLIAREHSPDYPELAKVVDKVFSKLDTLYQEDLPAQDFEKEVDNLIRPVLGS